MDPRVEVWNVLHDGEIVQIEKGAALVLTVEIPYLRRMFGEGTHIILTLEHCRLFSMKIWEPETKTDDVSLIAEQRTTILSAKSDGTTVHVFSTEGEINADFAAFSLKLDDGGEVSFEELCEASERYWEKWPEK